MLPEDPFDRALVLPPGQAVVEAIDPRLYCFGAKAFGALAPGSIVVARLDPGRLGRSSPNAVGPVEDDTASIGSLRAVEAPPVALPDDPTPELPEAWPHAAPVPRVTLTGPDLVDAVSSQDIVIPLTLRNEGSTPVNVHFRPDALGFDVSRPGSALQCAWPAPSPSPSRELYETVAAHGSATISIELAAYCPAAVFEHAGLMTVRPWLDTRNTSGRAIGLRTLDDLVAAARPTLVRLQRTSTPQPRAVPELVSPASP
jgi:hypothetical protein